MAGLATKALEGKTTKSFNKELMVMLKEAQC